MQNRAMRYGDSDKYWWRFTFGKGGEHYKPFGFSLNSGKEEAPNYFILCGFGYHLICVLPRILKPCVIRKPWGRERPCWAEKDYWEDQYNRCYGIRYIDRALHINYGRETYSSDTDQNKIWFIPWMHRRRVRYAVLNLYGHVAYQITEKNNRIDFERHRQIEMLAPKMIFDFHDFDGERLTATVYISEGEYALGEGKRWRWLSWFTPNKIHRSLNIEFSGETGRRKGSWKGGTLGAHVPIERTKLHREAFMDYAREEGFKLLTVVT